jgi:alcohol dehydrogenase, propanol-preferring
MENYCEVSGGLGGGGLAGPDGGMAPYMLVPATRFLIPLGSLDPREAAPLSDAGLTSYHAVKRSLHLLGPGSTAVVIGAGGLGQIAIQILRALSSSTTVVAVDTAADKLATAQRMGADEALRSGDEAVTGSRTSPADRAPSSSWTWSAWTLPSGWLRRWPGCVAT